MRVRARGWLCLFLACGLAGWSCAAPADPPVWKAVPEVRDWLNGAEPQFEHLHLDLPLVSEEGMSVPLAIDVTSAMTPDDSIVAIRVFAAGNPQPEVLDLTLDPRLGRAVFETRIRLDESQTVLVLARHSDGRVFAAEQAVRVANSGCLARSEEAFDAPMGEPRVAVPDPFPADRGHGEVRSLILHPMETGFREGPDGEPLPRRIIEDFSASLDGEIVLAARFHAAMSANPYLAFRLAPEQDGELVLRWRDETGEERSATRTVRVVD